MYYIKILLTGHPVKSIGSLCLKLCKTAQRTLYVICNANVDITTHIDELYILLLR